MLRVVPVLSLAGLTVLAVAPASSSSASTVITPSCATTTTTSTTRPSTTTTVVASTTTSTPTATTSTTSTTSTTVPATSTTTTVPATSTTTTAPKRHAFVWPLRGSAAIAIPELCVAAASPAQPIVPIASLTKMMTVWVILHRLPLSYAQQGPCRTVSAHDVALYHYDVISGQSNARIVLDEHICEGTLLRGLLVHSAGDYSELLRSILGWSQSNFVRVMNRDAHSLGLTRTHYVDLTGIAAGDRSTASDQASLAIDLMTNEPIVDQIVRLTHVGLPYNGNVDTYTPLLGTNGVVGVKSGFTDPAGGCDVMAVQVTIGKVTFLTYAVVLGQNGANPLAVAGENALALSRAMRSFMVGTSSSAGTLIRWLGPTTAVR